MSSPTPSASSPTTASPFHRLRRAPVTPPPERPSWYPVDDKRNSEANHIRALEEARLLHERVRETALAVLHINQATEKLALLEVEEARIAALEQANAEAEQKTKELNERTAAINAAAQAHAQAHAQALAQAQAAAQVQTPPVVTQPPPAAAASAPVISPQAPTNLPVSQPLGIQAPPAVQQITQVTPPTQHLVTTQPTPRGLPLAQPFSAPQQLPAPPTPAAAPPRPISEPREPYQVAVIEHKESKTNPIICKDNERLKAIHQKLKELRNDAKELFAAHPNIKLKAGNMRRQIRMSVGQLTGSETQQLENKKQVETVFAILHEALVNKVTPTPLLDPDDYVVDCMERDEVPGAANNGKLPFMFLFLLNHFSKAIIAQLAEEAGIKPHMAASISILAVKVFSNPSFLWRGKPLIDILIAKYRVVCPVLFGIRGKETTPGGRERLGWQKVGGKFIRDEVHFNRMTGFGAGYASLCLRDFSKSKVRHPYSVSYYWMAMASILATPPEKVSRTQCFVLKAMIDNYEAKFFRFYGAAALAALQIATVHFPARIAEQNDATLALRALPAKMKLQMGIDLIDDAFRA